MDSIFGGIIGIVVVVVIVYIFNLIQYKRKNKCYEDKKSFKKEIVKTILTDEQLKFPKNSRIDNIVEGEEGSSKDVTFRGIRRQDISESEYWNDHFFEYIDNLHYIGTEEGVALAIKLEERAKNDKSKYAYAGLSSSPLFSNESWEESARKLFVYIIKVLSEQKEEITLVKVLEYPNKYAIKEIKENIEILKNYTDNYLISLKSVFEYCGKSYTDETLKTVLDQCKKFGIVKS